MSYMNMFKILVDINFTSNLLIISLWNVASFKINIIKGIDMNFLKINLKKKKYIYI